ncbi:MAG: hypothetical protein WDZ35_00230 [Crocinitomicaceae bacterium]
MKNLMLSLLFACTTTLVSFAQELKIEATYNGFDGTFYTFSDLNDEYYEFSSCAPSVLKEFDLQSEEHIYQYFAVTYVRVEDEDGTYRFEITQLSLVEEEEEEIEY